MKHFPQPQLSQHGTSRWLLPVLGLAAFGAALPEKAGAQTRIGAPQRLSALVEAPSPILISELRPGGPRGAQDAFVELFNTTSQPISLTGWTLRFRVSKEATANVQISPDARIEARGHLLLAARDYSLGALATADGQYTAPMNGGVALCDAQGEIIDAVGPDGADFALREGAGLPAFIFAAKSSPIAPNGAKTPPIPQFSLVRNALDGEPQDSGDNARDFTLVSVNGALWGQKTRIGVPGPENAASPCRRAKTVTPQAQTVALQTDPERNSMRRARRDTGPLKTFGTMTLRYRMVNDTPNTIKSLSFRVNGITADPNSAAADSADVRLIRGPVIAQSVQKPLPATVQKPQSAASETPRTPAVPIWRARLSATPSQPLGGALNALINVELPADGIAPGASGEVWFSFGVERRGNYRVVLGNQTMNLVFEGNTEDDISGVESQKLDGGFVRSRQRSVSLIQGGGANGNGNSGGPNGTPGALSPVPTPPVEEADGFLIEGNTEDGVVPTPPKPSSKAS